MTNYEKVKAWRALNKDKVAEQNRRYAIKHPETHEKAAAKYRAANLDKIRERDRVAQDKRRKSDPEAQKIRNERYAAKKEARLWDQAGRPRADRCELCLTFGLTVFDHCHDKGHFRGWICDRCNRVLGSVNDDIDLLKSMIDYLKK